MPLDELHALLTAREEAADPTFIDTRIRARFLARRAVLFVDMGGFTRLTEQHGIEHFLGLIHRMRTLCVPAIEAHGTLVKAEADNLFARFDTPQQALAAAALMHASCRVDAAGRASHDRVTIGVGIGWGDVLDIDGHDVFGQEVNVASRLGEDLSRSGEVLLTGAAYDALAVPAVAIRVEWSGAEVCYYRVNDDVIESFACG